jgi:uncharacterized membrane protein YfcA
VHVYLPIAQLSESVIVLLAIGGGIGFLSGLFGVGGGFLLTPLLIFIGISAPVAVASGANQVLGASVSGVIVHWGRGNVDLKMGLVLLAGALAGSWFGIWLFGLLNSIGQVELAISLSYVTMLSTIGGFMFFESFRRILPKRGADRTPIKRSLHRHFWLHALPFKLRFYRSRLYISALLPLIVGAFVGMMSAIMGVGGGFLMVPAMIYLIGMPTAVVVGTSLFLTIFVTANVTFLQAYSYQTVDVLLAILMLIGGVVGAQFGARLAPRVPADRLRILLALLVLGVAAKMLVGLMAHPTDLYTAVYSVY